jgi:hypothetical protein
VAEGGCHNPHNPYTASDLEGGFPPFRGDARKVFRKHNGGFPDLGPERKIIENVVRVHETVKRFGNKKLERPGFYAKVYDFCLVFLLEIFHGKVVFHILILF